jgi:DNA-directed RNA polymerase alpha subunit
MIRIIRHQDPKSIESLRLTTRTFNVLVRGRQDCWLWAHESILTVDELVRQTEKHLLRRPGMGLKAIAEIKEALAERGLTLSEDDTPLYMKARQLAPSKPAIADLKPIAPKVVH